MKDIKIVDSGTGTQRILRLWTPTQGHEGYWDCGQWDRDTKDISLLKTKRNLLYIRNQSVPSCKHFPPRL